MRITIRGRRWTLRFLPMRHDGECDGPHCPKKEIRIKDRLTGRRRLETIIHEILHAAHWDLGEEAIQETGEDLARILWQLGYRGGGQDGQD